jgi:phenylacetate-CoA ligase
VSDEHVNLEVVDDENRVVWEKPGRILVTDLDNHAMPLIRYEIGDEGILTRERCACGRAHTVLASIQGRTQDYIYNSEGRRLSATFFAGFFRDLQHIGRLQLNQLSPASVRLDYEGKGLGADEEARQLCREIRARLGIDMQVTPRHVQSVFITDRGKIPLIRHSGGRHVETSASASR